ncbi:MAG: translocation/assembly module TamB domain-containing protein [Cyanobacteria bacterium P01_A01_bin.84]
MTNFKSKNHNWKSLIKNPLQLLAFSRKRIAFGCILFLVGGGIGFWRLQTFIHHELAPLAQKNLKTILNRPLQLGEVKDFSLTGVRFGASAIPPTATDSDKVTIDAVEVGFDPLQLLLNRTLKLDVTLVNPNVYIQQDSQGRWVTTSLNFGEPGSLQVDLEKIRVRNGKLVLAPFKKGKGKTDKTGTKNGNQNRRKNNLEGNVENNIQGVINNFNNSTTNTSSNHRFPQESTKTNLTYPLTFNNLNGSTQLQNSYRLIKLDLRAESGNGGNISVAGDVRPQTQKINLDVRGQNLLAANITSLIPIPINLQSGRVDGKVNIQWNPGVSPLLFGSTNLKDVKLQVPQAPQAFINSQGNVDFDGTKIRLSNIKTNYGKIPLEGGGVIDWEDGYDVVAKVKAVEVKNARDTLNLALPVPVKGELSANVRLAGKILNPLITGKVSTNKTATLDKVNFKSITGNFQFSTSDALVSLSNIVGKPVVGGEIRGGGVVKLSDTPQLNLNFTAQNLPGDAIASLYNSGYNSDSGIKVGILNARVRISGSPSNAFTAVNFQAPQGTYPARGELLVAPDRSFTFRNVRVAVAGGEVRTRGKWNNQKWEAVADARGIKVKEFVSPQQLESVSGNVSFNNALNSALFKGRLLLSGNSESFTVNSIKPVDAKILVAGGSVKITQLQFNQTSFYTKLVASGIHLKKLFKQSTLGLNGIAGGNFELAGSRNNFNLKTLHGKGTASLSIAGGSIKATNILLANGNYRARVQTNNLKLKQLTPQLASGLPSQFQGSLTSDFLIAGSTESFSPNTLQARGKGKVQIGRGTIGIPQIQLANGLYKAKFSARDIPLKGIVSVLSHLQGKLTGDLLVAGSIKSFSPESFSPENISAIARGKLNIGNGQVIVPNMELSSGRYRGKVIAQNLPLQGLVSLPGLVQGGLDSELIVAGSTKSFSLNEFQGQGRARLRVAGGTVNANNIQVTNGRVRAIVDGSGVELNKFNQDLRGKFAGKLQVALNLQNPSLSATQATGQVNLSQGLGVIEQPLSASFTWNGEKLQLQKARSQNFSASGNIIVDAKSVGIPKITDLNPQLNLQVQARDYNLNKLPLNLPNGIKIAGNTDFNGKIAGRLLAPNLQGQLSLRNLVVDKKYAFEKYLNGVIDSSPETGLNLSLRGQRDKIDFSLNSKNQPQNFDIKWQQASARGQLQGDEWKLKLDSFPVGALNLKLPVNNRLGPGNIVGKLSGDFQFNQRTLTTAGNAVLTQPQIGRIKGDRLSAQFSYQDGSLNLADSKFLKGKSSYAFVGSISPTATVPQVKGEFKVGAGKVQDILTALQIFEIEDLQTGFEQADYGKAKDLDGVESVGLPEKSLSMQWRRLSEITRLLEQQEEKRREASPFPQLASLQGSFDASVKVDTTVASGLSLQFNLEGEKFSWGQKNEPRRFYDADRVIVSGRLDNNIVTLQPLRIESTDKLIAFTGTVGSENQSGQLQIKNFPLQTLENFIKSPLSLSGKLSATASLAGSLSNPQAKGELEITDAYLNQKGVKSANASFAYSGARLNFDSNIVVAEEEPVTISGKIPYKLPFATVLPESENLELDVKVKNQGLAILNLFTNQLVFEAGEGNVDLSVRGTLEEPEVIGIASINNATFNSESLPEKLTEVRGNLEFDFDRIVVNNLQGKFSKGKIEAIGEIPIITANQGTQINNPLTVNLDKLALNLKGLYQGGINGNLQIRGSAFDPKIGGQLLLSNGKVLLAESDDVSNQSDRSGFSSLKVSKTDNLINNDTNLTRFNALKLILGKKVEIARPPILNFEATGSLILRGSLNEPKPEGTIKLRKGGVNLFTTQFNLAKGHENTATFRKNQPNDPDLNIQLFAKVLDVIQSSDLNRPNSTGLAALETVRVEANIEGPASKLNENLELISSPARSETEIVALLGGGFVDTQGRGNSTLGLINIAGSAVFNNFQTAFSDIGTAFGLSELRIFPTLISEDLEAGKSSSSLEIAAEGGIDITPKISVSGIKILTATDPFQWGLNYRIDNQFRLRGSTNFFDDNRAVLEYQRRF